MADRHLHALLFAPFDILFRNPMNMGGPLVADHLRWRAVDPVLVAASHLYWGGGAPSPPVGPAINKTPGGRGMPLPHQAFLYPSPRGMHAPPGRWPLSFWP